MSQKKVFNAKVLTISENVLQNNNDRGTEDVIATIQHPLTKQPLSARVYMNNLVRNGETVIKPGLSYLCTAQTYTDPQGNTQVDITVSHLTSAPRAAVADFDTLPGEVIDAVPQGSSYVKNVTTA